MLGELEKKSHFTRRLIAAAGLGFACVLAVMLMLVDSGLFSFAAATPPRILPYQGRILDTNGVPVSDATANMQFRLFDAPSGPTCLWSNASSTCASNADKSVTLTSGLFSENLGDTGAGYAAIPATVFANNPSLYIEVEINGETLAPRKLIGAAGFALNADTLDGLDSTDFALVGSSFVQNGNSFGTTAVLGTNDANDLQFETNNVGRVTIDTSGVVTTTGAIESGVGNAPAYTFSADPTAGLSYDNTVFGVPATRINGGTNGIIDLASLTEATDTFAIRTVTPGSFHFIISPDANLGTFDYAIGDHNETIISESSFPTGSAGAGTSVFYVDDVSHRLVLDNNGTSYFPIVTTGETETFTSNAWTFQNDMAVTLGGGVNGLNVDAGTFSVDASNHRVGIGDTTPAALLTVGSGDLFQVSSAGLVAGPDGSVGGTTFGFTSDPAMGLFRAPDDNFPLNEALHISSGSSFFIDINADVVSAHASTFEVGNGINAGAANIPGQFAVVANGALTFTKFAGFDGVTVMTEPTPAADEGQAWYDNVAGRIAFSNDGNPFSPAVLFSDLFSSTLDGIVPASGGGTTNFLRADGTWAAPSGGGGGGDLQDAYDNSAGINHILTANTVDGLKFDLTGGSFQVRDSGSTAFATFTTGGNVSFANDVTLGDSNGDNVAFNADVNSSIIPNTDNAFNLGSNLQRWQDLFLDAGTLHIGSAIGDEATVSYDTSVNDLNILNGSPTPRLSISSAGLVGIGTTSPTSLLDVASATPQTIQVRNTANSANVSLNTNTSAGDSSAAAANDLGDYISMESEGSAEAGNFLGVPAANLADVYSRFGSGLAVGTFDAQPLTLSTNNAARLTISSTGTITTTGIIQGADGTAGAPAYSFSADTNTGMFRIGGDDLGFSTGGTNRVEIDSSGNVGIGMAPAGNQLAVLNNLLVQDTTSGTHPEYVVFNTESNAQAIFEANGSTVPGSYMGQPIAGSVNLLATGTDTSMTLGTFASAPLIIGTSNTARLSITSGGLVSVNGDGNAAAPILSFGNTADPNTGIFHPAADNLAISTNGSEIVRWGASGSQTIETITAGTFAAGTHVQSVTGTFTGGSGSTQWASEQTFTGAGSGSGSEYGVITTLAAGYTGSGNSNALVFENDSQGTGVSDPRTSGFASQNQNSGIFGDALGSTAGTNVGSISIGAFGAKTFGAVGVAGYGGLGYRQDSLDVGVVGTAVLAKNGSSTTEQHVGVEGHAFGGDKNVAGYFSLDNGAPTYPTDTALAASNGSTLSNIFTALDNTTAVMTIIDGGNVGIGTASPSSLLDVVGATPIIQVEDQTGSNPVLRTIAYNSSGGAFPAIQLFHTRGTRASPTATQSGDDLGQIQFGGNNGSATGSHAEIDSYATETWTGSANGSKLTFLTTPNGSTAEATIMRIDQNGFVNIGNGDNAANNRLTVNGSSDISGNVAIGTTSTSGVRLNVVAGTLSATSDRIIQETGTFASGTSGVMRGNTFTVSTPSSTSATHLIGNTFTEDGSFTGSGAVTRGLEVDNVVASANTGNPLATGNDPGNLGIYGFSAASTAGSELGVRGDARSSTLQNIGVLGESIGPGTNGDGVGVAGYAANASGTGKEVGGYFAIGQTGPTLASTALLVENNAEAFPIAIFRDNGSAVMTIADNGDVTVAPNGSATGDALTVTAGTLAASKHALTVTGTLPATPTGDRAGARIDITSAGSGSNSEYGVLVSLESGFTGTAPTFAFNATNTASGVGGVDPFNGDSNANVGNVGAFDESFDLNSGVEIGAMDIAAQGAISIGTYGVTGTGGLADNGFQADSTNYGVFGAVTLAKNGLSVAEKHIGVTGTALNGDVNVGGFFGLGNTTPTYTSAALMADNGTESTAGGGTPTPIFVARDFGSSVFTVEDGGSLLAEGTLGTTPASGSGTRLMWIPAKAAFRAGIVNSDQWDDANIGTNSIAMGFNAKASNSNAVAIGRETLSTSTDSIAIGDGSLANSDDSFAFGDGARARNADAFAIGDGATADGGDSLAIGDGASATGDDAHSIGDGTIASGNDSTAIGDGAVSGGQDSMALMRAHSDAANSFAAGLSNLHSNATLAFAFGDNYTNANDHSLSVGTGNIDNLIDSNGNSWFNLDTGNVGIGTNTPGAKLSVIGGNLTDDTSTGASGMYFSGTLQNTSVGTNSQAGFRLDVTGNGGGTTSKLAEQAILGAGYTGSGVTVGGDFENISAGTGNNLHFNTLSNPGGNSGLNGFAYGTTATGLNIGSYAAASNGLMNVGAVGASTDVANGGTNIGVIGTGRNTGTTPIEIGGYFGLFNSTPTFDASAGLIASNGSTTDDIFLARDNNSTVFTIADGGNITASGDLALNGGDLTSSSATFNVAASATTLNLAGGSGSTGCTVDGTTGNLTCTGTITASGGGAFVNGGNSFGALATLGTNDNNSLAFETNNTTGMTLDTTGSLNIGGGSLNSSTLTTFNLSSGKPQIALVQGDNADSLIQMCNNPSDCGRIGYGHSSGSGSGVDSFDLFMINDRGFSNGGLALGVQGATVEYISHAGNVGIGDTSPAALFTVANGDLFQVNSSGNVTFQNNANHTIVVADQTTTDTVGRILTIAGGMGNGTGNGGDLRLNAGDGGATSGTGGNVIITSGQGASGASSGLIQILSDSSTSATSGEFHAGSGGAVSADSGIVLLKSGNTVTSGNSGDVTVDVGTAAGTNGNVHLGDGNALNVFVGNAAGEIKITTQAGARTQVLCQSGGGSGDGVALTDGSVGDCSAAGQADYAEQYPIAPNTGYGDIVASSANVVTSQDGNKVPQMVKSSSPYQQTVVGIVVNNYGDLTSSGYNIDKADNPMPVALVGRVPVKVNAENGAIAVGDPITSSSTPGQGMKATKAGRIVGYALDAFDPSAGASGPILVFVSSSFYPGDGSTQPTAGTSNGASGFGSNGAASFTALNMSGNIYMAGNAIINVGQITGLNGAWSVDGTGTFATKGSYDVTVKSYQDEDVTTHAVLSRTHQITLNGFSTIQNGTATIRFEDIDPKFNDIISTTAPMTVLVTPRGPAYLYVTSQDHDGFTVQQLNGADSDIRFDWMVSAYRKDEDPAVTVPADAPPAPPTDTAPVADPAPAPDAPPDDAAPVNTSSSPSSPDPTQSSSSSPDPAPPAPAPDAPADTSPQTDATPAPDAATAP